MRASSASDLILTRNFERISGEIFITAPELETWKYSTAGAAAAGLYIHVIASAPALRIRLLISSIIQSTRRQSSFDASVVPDSCGKNSQ
jgi:hypothetical protein